MKNTEWKVLGIAGILFGLCNIIPSFVDTRWYAIFCFILLGIPEVIFGIIMMNSNKPEQLRSQSWINEIMGISILVLALSPFYASPILKALNFIAAIGLILSGLYGLYICSKKFRLPIVS